MPGFAFVLPAVIFVAQAAGQGGTLDPAFKKIDLDHWVVERHPSHLHLTGSVGRPELSFHQRLVSWIEVELDGGDLAARRGHGELMIFIQITDHAGMRYQSHGRIDLSKVDDNVRTIIFDYFQRAFFLPGDYRLEIGMLDSGTGEHVAREMQFRIQPPRYELLKGAWRDLPPVEFISREKSPDNWYLPGTQGRLRWKPELPSPALVNIVLNVAPSLPTPGSRPTPSSGLAALLPTLKALSQIGNSSLSERVELLDLSRRRAFFQQDDVHDLDWPDLKKSLAEATTATIDIHSLSERHHDAQFFVSEVRRLLRASTRPSILVVLTTAVVFEGSQELEPISLAGLPHCSVVYIRYRFVPPRRGWRARMDRSIGGDRLGKDLADQLEPTLAPLNPRVFDVTTPEEMGRAIAEVERLALSSDE